jgi:lysophospholipase L1-like esterase
VKNFLFILVTVLLIGVLISGHLHWQNKIRAAGIEGKIEVEKILAKEKAENESLIESLKPENNISQAPIDFLRYKALVQEEIKITAIGIDGTAGVGASHFSRTWANILESRLRLDVSELSHLKMKIQGFEGYSSSDLINSGKIDNVIAWKPDLIFLESPVLNNFFQSITIEQTEKDMENIVESIKSSLPDVRIIFLLSHPIVNSNEQNNIGLSYQDYLNASLGLAKKKKWSYIDSNEAIISKVKEKNAVLADIMVTDNYHLNDTGYNLLFEVIMEYLKEE